VVEHGYENEVYLTTSRAIYARRCPNRRCRSSETPGSTPDLKDALGPHLQHGTLVEPIEAEALIGIAHTSHGRT
jgi:hypothetical protein